MIFNYSGRVGTYHCLDHNCNKFSNQISMILFDKSIPKEYISFETEILNSFDEKTINILIKQNQKNNQTKLVIK